MSGSRWGCIALLPPCLVALSCAEPHSPSSAELIRALDDPHWQVRASAAEALGHQRDGQAVPRLAEALADDSSAVRAAAVMSLGRLGASSELDEIAALIHEDDSPQVQVQGLYALAALADARYVDLAIVKLSDDSRRVKRAARRVLWQLIDRRELVATIESDLRAESRRTRRRAALMAAELDLDELAGWERRLLDDPDPSVRTYAYREIRSDPDHDDLATLLEGLKDASPGVRRASADGLGKLADPAVLPELRAVLVGDADKSVRTAAAKALASILGSPGRVLPALWHFERIFDRVQLAPDGQCTLVRSLSLRIEESAEAIQDLRILMPESFPQVDRVVDADGAEVEFDLDWHDGLRHLEIEVAPLESGQAATFTIVARSRRPLFASGEADALIVYSPGPVQAPVRELLVELLLPEAGIRVLEPADARIRTQADGKVVSLSRTELSIQEAPEVSLRVAVPLSALELLRAPPRFYSKSGDLTTAAAVVVVFLACLAAVIVWLRRKMGRQADRAILAAVLVAGAVLLLSPTLLEDNLTYYALARSAVLDGDLDRVNEYTELNQTQAYTPDNRGPMDPALGSLFRTPFLALAHGLTLGLNAVSFQHAANGFSFPYLFVTALGDFLAVLVGCLACFSLVERRVGQRYALYAVLGVVGGTNLLLFTYGWTGSSFQPSFLLFALFLNYWDKSRDERSWAGWLAAGVLLGLLGMTRTLNLGFGLLPAMDWIYLAIVLLTGAGVRRVVRHVGHGALFAAGVFFGFAPQLILHRLVDDRWFVDTYGVGTGRLAVPFENLWGLFVSRSTAYDGLLPAMPLLGLACLGLVPLIRFDRRLGTLLVATLGLQLCAIGSYEIYWGYFKFGTSYVVPSAPIFCLGLAGLLRAVHARWRRFGPAVLGSVIVLCVVRNGWCVLRQLASDMIGQWHSEMSVLQVLHSMLLLDRKLNVDVLGYSSEFGCLLREMTGAVRSGDPRPLLAALLWISLLLVPLLLVAAAWRRLGRWTSRVGPGARRRLVVAGWAVAWIALVGWLVEVGSGTDLDYDYQRRRRTERRRELKVERLEPGRSFQWTFALNNPCERFSIITFLDDAVDVRDGERVATVEIDVAGQRTPFEIRAGLDTADFAIEQPELQAARAHGVPQDKVCYSWRVRDDSSHYYTARAYCNVFEVPSVGRRGTVEVTSSLERGALSIAMYTARERRVPRDPSRRRWLAERW